MQKVTWHRYNDIFHQVDRHTVAGNIKIAQRVFSAQLKNERDLIVYLPPSYDHSDNRYPVLYMHDGYNLFDGATSYAQEWHVDETMELLGREEGLEAIVVGIPTFGNNRLNEYSPWKDDKYGGGLGKNYMAFVTRTVKPIIDRDFRTLPNKRNTGLMGSSMGGLVSLFGFFEFPDIFGFVGIMSPSLWFANERVFQFVKEQRYQHGRIYLDAGTLEMGGGWPDQGLLLARSTRYSKQVLQLKRLFESKGYRPNYNLLYVEGEGDGHNESAWAGRLPEAIRFFLRP